MNKVLTSYAYNFVTAAVRWAGRQACAFCAAALPQEGKNTRRTGRRARGSFLLTLRGAASIRDARGKNGRSEESSWRTRNSIINGQIIWNTLRRRCTG